MLALDSIRLILNEIAQGIISEVPESGRFKSLIQLLPCEDRSLFPVLYFGMEYHLLEIDEIHAPHIRYLDIFLLLPGNHKMECEACHGTNDQVWDAIMTDDFPHDVSELYQHLLDHIKKD